MSSYREWIFTLGIVALSSGIATAGPLSLLQRKEKSSAESPVAKQTSPDSRKVANQQVAEKIAGALRKADLRGHDIHIDFYNGTAVLTGKIGTVADKAQVSKLVGKVKGVERVHNRLRLEDARTGFKPANPATTAAGRQNPVVPVAATQPVPQSPLVRGTRRPGAEPRKPSLAQRMSAAPKAIFGQKVQPTRQPDNQQMAQRIADAMSSAPLDGFDINIQYQKGIATLTGSVTDRQQWGQAMRAAYSVPGVRAVKNQLKVEEEPQHAQQVSRQVVLPQRPPYVQPPTAGPVMRPSAARMSTAAYQPQPPAPSQNGGQAAQGAAPGVPSGYGHPGAGESQMMYNMPNVPEYAWPSYASYPNYSQVAYPGQYSASAWPYIGPFYPYPQVPLGWRNVQLEWDDGYWALNFSPRTDKWWWFLNPHNW